MSFPTIDTTPLDTFDRADGAPGVNWTTPYAYTDSLGISSNQLGRAVGGTTSADGAWAASDFGPNTEVIATVGIGAGAIYIYTRAFLTTGINGYLFYVVVHTGQHQFHRYVDGAFTKLGATGGGASFSPGDKIGTEIYGQDETRLTLYQWTSAAWYEMGARNDNAAPHLAAGKVVIEFTANAPFIDDFNAGTMVGDPEDHSSFAWPTDMQEGQGQGQVG